MAKVEDCPGFETFGADVKADVKAARKARRLARKALAEMVGIEWRYLANIENKGTIPSLPVVIQLIKTCGLPVERYFNPEVLRSESEQRQRVGHKLKLCPEEYLPVIEGAIDGAIQIEAKEERNGGCLKTILCFLLFAGTRKRPLFFCTFFRGSPCFAGSLELSECTYSGEEQKQQA